MLFSAAFVSLTLSVLGAVASPAHMDKRTVSTAIYDDLVYYFQYASSAYSDSCANPNGNTLIEEFNDALTDTQGFIARDDTRKEIVVVLRGSTSEEDFLTDSDITLVAYSSSGVTPPSGVEAHSVFLGAWNAVASGVISTVKSQLAAHPGYAIVTSGHSLGGALSSLAAISLASNFPSSSARMYTYGQPRTGNPAYASWVNGVFGANAFRGTHTSDGVPTIIPTYYGYQHHGIEYWQNPDPSTAANTKACSADGEDITCSASILSEGINAAHLTYFGIYASTTFCSTT